MIRTEVILYADVLFIIDFSMDFVSLYFVGKLTHSKMKAPRFAVAASVGGLFSVICTAYPPPAAVGFVLSILCSAIMGLIALGKTDLFAFVRRIIILWAAGALLGGVMTALLSIGEGKNETAAAVGENSGIFIFIVLGVGAAFIMVRVIGHVSKKRVVEVKVYANSRKAEFKALADSGNLLTDPFSGEPVIIASAEAVRSIFDTEEFDFLTKMDYSCIPESMKCKIRLIPARGLAGEKVLCAVKPDAVFIDGKGSEALLAVESTGSGEYGSFDGIVPSSVI